MADCLKRKTEYNSYQSIIKKAYDEMDLEIESIRGYFVWMSTYV